MLAKPMFGSVESIPIEEDGYTGYMELYLTDDEMADFYSNPLIYGQNLKVNQYANIYNSNKELVDTLLWTGDNFR
jgi:hypothetical protein